MEKTVVEWLFEQFISGSLPKKYLLEQAKEMEKQQIIDAWDDGNRKWSGAGDSETYYENTFKKSTD